MKQIKNRYLMHRNQQDKTTDNAPATSQYRNTPMLLGTHKRLEEVWRATKENMIYY